MFRFHPFGGDVGVRCPATVSRLSCPFPYHLLSRYEIQKLGLSIGIWTIIINAEDVNREEKIDEGKHGVVWSTGYADPPLFI